MPVQHLIDLVESKRSAREQHGVRPDWVTNFIDEMVDCFEPLGDVGRVGFECAFDDDHWAINLYLGNTEVVGGPADGQTRHADFQFDFLPLLDRFTQVDRLFLSALSDDSAGNESVSAAISIEGRLEENHVRVNVHAVPPSDAGPGFREYLDGRVEPV
jgi:hypothetical protein